MATINISSVVSYYNSATKSTSGTKSVSGYSSALAAKNAAKTAATNAANSVGAGTPSSGGSSSTTDLKFGSSYGSVSGGAGTPGAAMDPDEGTYEGWCSYSSSRTSTMYLVKLKFTIPAGLTAANIVSATISFTATASHTTDTEYRICAPKTTSEQTNYLKYGDTTIIDTSKYVSFNAPKNTSAKSYSLTFTDVFKQCITNGLGWVTILIPRNTPESSRIMTLSGTPQITYTENYSACKAPTSISFTSIVKPGGTLTISWSGAEGGTNNTISGYDIYYKIGSAPTTSSYTDMANVSSTSTSGSKSFTVPSSASNNRGDAFYAMVRTKGKAGASYYSGWKEGNGGKVNSLPDAPTIASVSSTRIKSTGGTVTFTITAGSDSDSGLTLSVWYNTDGTSWSGNNCKQVPSNGQLTTPTLTSTTTYYFKTWDGLEYSSRTASQTITKNVKPTISSVTMTAGTTYSPNIIIQNTPRSYVKSITGSTTATSSTGTVSKYYWKLLVWAKTTDAAAPSWSGGTNIGNPTTTSTLSSTDVTKYNATFNTAYRLAVIVEDDIGELSTEAYSGTIFGIPPAPTVNTIYNLKADSNKGGNTNSSHFENGIRIKYNPPENTGVTRTLSYYDGSKWNSITRSAGTNLYDDLTLSSLSRGTNYKFKVVFSCGDASTTYTSGNYMRALNIKPTDIATSPISGNVIKPYTLSTFNFSFCHELDLVAWKTTLDVANYNEAGANPSGIYTIKITSNVSESTPIICSMGSNTTLKVPTNKTKYYVSGTIDLSSIKTSQWIDLLKTTIAPNASYSLTLEITATNGFGEPFVGTQTFTVNFIEGFVANLGSLTLKIKTGAGASDFTNIPTNTYNSSNRYPLFPTQTIRFTVSGLLCYANQDFRVEARDTNADGTILGFTTGSASDWELLSGSNRIYKLKNSKSIDYLINSISTTTDKTFCMKIILLGNNQTKTDLTSSICKYRRILTSSISPKIFLVSELDSLPNNFTFTYLITDYGGDSTVGTGFSSASLLGGYSAITGRFFKCSSAGGTYSTVGSSSINLKGKNTDNLTISINDSNNSPLNTDIIYFGFKLYLTVAFVKIGSATPTGTSYYEVPSSTKPFLNLYTFYRETPNLLYGKNFFALNQNLPIGGRTKLLLEISTALYTSGNSTITRDTIYFGTDGTNFQITGNGLVIDCGSW